MSGHGLRRIVAATADPVPACLLLILMLGGALLVWHEREEREELLAQIAIEHAASYAELVEVVRQVYASEVVDRLSGTGVDIAHDYKEREHAIPLPAALSRLLGRRLSEGSGAQIHLYSPYPYPRRESEGGLRDAFARNAWEALRADPDTPYFRFVDSGAERWLRYARADLMQPSCVACHNGHPESPKRDWQVGEVRGVLEIAIPVEGHHLIASVGEHQSLSANWLLLPLAALALLLVLAARRRERSRAAALAGAARQAEALARETEWRRLVETAVENASEAMVITDPEGKMQYVNPAFERMTGYTRQQAIGQSTRLLKSGYHDSAFYAELWQKIRSGKIWSGKLVNRRKDGTFYHEEATISPVRDADGEIVHFVSVKRDVTRERDLEAQLSQSQKLEAIGQLAAGIAHEINTPTQYVMDNTRFLDESFGKLGEVLAAYAELREAAQGGSVPTALLDRISGLVGEADLEFLNEEIPKAIRESLEGLSRVSSIVRAMKEFSHPGTADKSCVDLNQALRSTVTVARNEWKYVANVVLELAEHLPPVPCHPAELNQVFLNLIVNAAHAIGGTEKEERAEKGTITIGTALHGDQVEVTIRDDGGGIPEEIRSKIFEPFFTTKGVGRGTGQGLAIARSVVVDKHGGTLDFNSVIGEGTTFRIHLPLGIDGSDGTQSR
ncbi:MAG: ATP-binding protein [Myxococcota bacterium]